MINDSKGILKIAIDVAELRKDIEQDEGIDASLLTDRECLQKYADSTGHPEAVYGVFFPELGPIERQARRDLEAQGVDTKSLLDGFSNSGPTQRIPWATPEQIEKYAGYPILTLRDQFAIAALSGLLSSGRGLPSAVYSSSQFGFWAADAYLLADAMLEARKTGPR